MANNYDEITSKIIEHIQSGSAPWHKPWTSSNPDVSFQLPVNGVTGNRYNGINIAMLWMAADEKAFTTNQYATFKQWAGQGDYVRKGEKATTVYYFDHIERENDKQEIDKIPFLKKFQVFNRCQLQSYEPQDLAVTHTPPLIERLDHAEAFIQNTGARIYDDGGNRAYYSRASDSIHMPKAELFTGTPDQSASEARYAVTFHEMGHWTGREGRLDRQFGKRFGDKAYAAEEIVAEITSAFTCNHLAISGAPSKNSASYISTWLSRLDLIKTLQSDSRIIMTAASQASKALDYIIAFQENKAANDNVLVRPLKMTTGL